MLFPSLAHRERLNFNAIKTIIRVKTNPSAKAAAKIIPSADSIDEADPVAYARV